jgi:ATP-dependent exoDNAse (exonuclease V) alpha subunit
MASYHCSIKPVSRGNGRSSTAAAAYRAGVCITDERTGEVHDYTRKKGVEYTELVLPEGVSFDREELWNAAENSEKRKDARVAREFELALPAELTPKQRRELATDFAKSLVDRYGVAADVSVHEPSRNGDQRNHHAHILITTRQISAQGLGEKTDLEREDKALRAQGKPSGRKQIEALRADWATRCNRTLERAGHEARVSHKSLAAQGIHRAPSVHLGPTATAMERRGIRTERGNLNRAAIAPSPERAELASLERQQQGIHAAKQRLRIEKAARAAAKAESERQRIRQEAERQRQREEAERRQKEAERQRLEEEKQRTEARTLFARYVRGLGGTAEQQAAQVQRMLTAWEQQAAQERAAILSETRQSIEQRERAQNERQRSRGPRMGR